MRKLRLRRRRRVCEICGKPGARLREDPYLREVFDEICMRALCNRCWLERREEV
jgi:hypothetical protein